jgi:hypothetical protein
MKLIFAAFLALSLSVFQPSRAEETVLPTGAQIEAIVGKILPPGTQITGHLTGTSTPCGLSATGDLSGNDFMTFTLATNSLSISYSPRFNYIDQYDEDTDHLGVESHLVPSSSGATDLIKESFVLHFQNGAIQQAFERTRQGKWPFGTDTSLECDF